MILVVKNLQKWIEERIKKIYTIVGIDKLPINIQLLFYNFKDAYENKDINQLKSCISDEFTSDLFGYSKQDCIYNFSQIFNQFPRQLNPFLVLKIFNITNTQENFCSLIIKFDVRFQIPIVDIPIPINSFAQGKYYFEAKPDGKYNEWRITKIESFKD